MRLAGSELEGWTLEASIAPSAIVGLTLYRDEAEVVVSAYLGPFGLHLTRHRPAEAPTGDPF